MSSRKLRKEAAEDTSETKPGAVFQRLHAPYIRFPPNSQLRMPKQTEKSENARKCEDQVDRVWLAVFDRDCHFSTPTKMLDSNVNSYREANIVLNHTDQISYDVYAQ